MSSNDDNCLPDELKDFVFDLHDSVRLSQIPIEQLALYAGKFRELTSKVSGSCVNRSHSHKHVKHVNTFLSHLSFYVL
jgi:hypothetical protein